MEVYIPANTPEFVTVSAYFVDWDGAGPSARKQAVELVGKDGVVFDRKEITSFGGGVWLSWKVNGSCFIKVSVLGGYNGAISGVFLDPADSLPVPPPVVPPPPPPPPVEKPTKFELVGPENPAGLTNEARTLRIVTDKVADVDYSFETPAGTLVLPKGSKELKFTAVLASPGSYVVTVKSVLGQKNFVLYAVDAPPPVVDGTKAFKEKLVKALTDFINSI